MALSDSDSVGCDSVSFQDEEAGALGSQLLSRSSGERSLLLRGHSDARQAACGRLRGPPRAVLAAVGVGLAVTCACEAAVWQWSSSGPAAERGGPLAGPRKGLAFVRLDEVDVERAQAASQQTPKASAAVGHVNHLVATQPAAAAAAVGGAEPEPVMKLRDESVRLVDELYTFGTPGASMGVLYDASREDGCIPGLRLFNRAYRYTLGSGIRYTIDDPISFITAAFGFRHARMEAMENLQDDPNSSPIHKCGAVAADPHRDDFWWFGGHMIYERIVMMHADVEKKPGHMSAPHGKNVQGLPDRLNRAYEMSHFAFVIYNVRTPLLGADAGDWGWTFVSRSCSLKKHNGVLSPACKDHVSLYQHDDTLECAVVMEGTRGDDVLDWLANLDVTAEPFCDFGMVHRGFKHKLWRMTRGLDYQQLVRAKLPKCNGVIVTGHSLGGTQAEMFTACANRGLSEGDEGFNDFRLIAFEKGAPEKMPGFYEDKAPGTFFRNKGNGLCLDVSGTMGTDYDTEVNVFDCEFPGSSSNYSKDQRFDLTAEGLLVNELSGKCVGLDGDELSQQACNRSSASDQRWELTPEGFVRSKRSGRCIDSSLKLYECPYTDQAWQLGTGGLIMNRLSGKCLDVGADGSATLQPCKGAGQVDFWELKDSGLIQNRRDGQCLKVRHERGNIEVATDSLVLAPCSLEESSKELLWDVTDDGFIKSRETGNCIDVAGTPGTKDGAAISLGPCEDQHLWARGLWKMMEGGFIRNTGTDWLAQYYCLEVMGAHGTDEKLQDGARFHMDVCKTNTDQKWQLTDDGLLKSVIGGQKCVDVRDALPGQPARLWLKNCEEWDDPIQFLDWKWDQLPDGRLKNRHALQCMDVAGQSEQADGASVDLWNCSIGSSGKSDRRWRVQDNGFIVNEASGKCLDVSGSAEAKDGSPLVLWDCDSRGEQTDKRWTLTPSGFLVNKLSAKCVTVAPGINSQGVMSERLVLQECPTPRQKWEVSANDQLRNRYTGECLDVAPKSTGLPGYDLVVWPCNDERVHQRWERLPAAW